MCKFFLSGNCSRGASCFWNHNTNSYPCKFYHLDKCCKMGSECRFSHSMIPEPEVEEFLRDNKEYLLEMYASKKLVGEAVIIGGLFVVFDEFCGEEAVAGGGAEE